MKAHTLLLFGFFLTATLNQLFGADIAMQNIGARQSLSLNGDWNVIIDPTGIGNWRKVWQEPVPKRKTDFFEYSFDGGPVLQVPGDFNSQLCELTWYEGTVWYQKKFVHTGKPGERVFLYFGAVNYKAEVYLNEKIIGSHEGGFTPFQFEITHQIVDGENTLVVKVNNERTSDGIPALGFDWLNYGGITRDVLLVKTPDTFIEDYFLQLEKGSDKHIKGWVQLNGPQKLQELVISIPEMDQRQRIQTDTSGRARIDISSKPVLWSPQNPKLYSVTLQSSSDSITDQIGFRNMDIQGTTVLLNGSPVFLKAVNIHEENPYKKARAFSADDDKALLTAAKELGCNMVRLAHYPHNETLVRMAEQMGLMVWSEIPVYQHIAFDDPTTQQLMMHMLGEMIGRDKNRCGVIVWSVSNETYPSRARDSMNVTMARYCRESDPTRLVSAAINDQGYRNNTFDVWDTLYRHFDLIALNQYLGWYVPWQGKPEEVQWKLVADKPLFISEFGGEAKFGSNYGPKDQAAYWSEEYQEQIYHDQVTLFEYTPNLCGVCPWLLFDYRSTSRLHPVYQNGYNRKGLLSENGEKKKAWYVVKSYYDKK
ncbi:MAG TPA: glycoside hydrolase family 2 TIM barrel-domain containing protein [Prolixibacteraceae bacterium]|nr:glycoside hydrolase family 2 TIM barrel-domain containing protein [Prolixibacteraceae bacterium]